MTIDEYRNYMMAIAEKTLPKESKKFLVTEALKLKRRMISYSNSNVPISDKPQTEKHKKYHKSFKLGKTYKYNEALSKRVFNATYYGKFVEYGRKVAVGYRKFDRYRNSTNVKGISKHYNVVENVQKEFDPIYYADTDAWIEKMLEEGKL